MNFKKLSLGLLASISLILTAACSSSSSGGGGGGGGAAKPDLNPAIEVSQSFSVVQGAGQSPGAQIMARGSIAAAAPSSSSSVELPPSQQQKAKTQALKQVISKPGDCAVQMETTGQSTPSPDPTKGFGTGFKLSISGAGCPMLAQFEQSMGMDVASRTMQVSLDFSFKAFGEDVKAVLGATEAELHGSFTAQPTSDGNAQTGGGIFKGHVSSVKFGRVEILSQLTLKGTQDSSVTTEETSLSFPDASKNLKLVRVTTSVQNQEPQVTCSANGVQITQEECDDVMGGIGGSTKNQSTDKTTQPQPTPTNPTHPGKKDPRPNPVNDLRDWAGRKVEITVTDAQALRQITALPGQEPDMMVLDRRLVRSQDIESQISEAHPACYVSGFLSAGMSRVEDVSSQSQLDSYVTILSLSGVSQVYQVICFTHGGPLSQSAVLKRTFEGVLNFSLR